MLVQKRVFSLQHYCFENGMCIPIELGYETYGVLSAAKDNVILVNHYFSATSHAAGRYTNEDEQAGWWDELIGPNKAIDTNNFFVICMDNLCNVQANHPAVHTTGPASINPETGKPYGTGFPPFSFRDIVHIQKELLQSLGITKLHAVIGPSAGGMIALQWAVTYPDWTERCIGVITNAQNPIITSFSPLQHGIRAIMLDPHWNKGDYYGGSEPTEGLVLAVQMMQLGAYSPSWYETVRDQQEQGLYQSIWQSAPFEKMVDNVVRARLAYCDANHWLYTCKATMYHDISYGYSSLQEAYERIHAKVLLISCLQDQLQPALFSKKTVEALQQLGKTASFYSFDSDKGHMAGVLETHHFEDDIRKWLES
ncbi:alpha/beta fold hydrolase [Ectobacillus polymachus]|uniref:alpha/beta fold hydrolase n=1 Tax=Ectobacillus polymachus TaxID=1508806 RepID=UPI003A89BDB4